MVKRSFGQTAANPNHLPHSQLVHSDLTFSAGSYRGGGGDCKRCRYRKWKRVSKKKWKREVKNRIDTGILILAGILQAGSEGEWSGRER